MLTIDPVRYNQQNTDFKAHPDFYALKNKSNVNASSYFRRGINYGVPSQAFQDVVDVLKTVFEKFSLKNLAKFLKTTLKNFEFKNIKNTFYTISEKIQSRKKNILIGGIADSQETFSILAVIKELVGKKSLYKKVNLNTVDLQSKPDTKKLYIDSFCDDKLPPAFALSSFVQGNIGIPEQSYRRFRIKDEILQFVHKAYNNQNNAKWDTRLQDAVKTYKDNSFDVISINNTFMYIKDKAELNETFENIYRILKKGGYFITDTIMPNCENIPKNNKNLTEVAPGIFKKAG